MEEINTAFVQVNIQRSIDWHISTISAPFIELKATMLYFIAFAPICYSVFGAIFPNTFSSHYVMS